MSIDLNRARAIVEKIKYLTVATVDVDSNPWNAPVFGFCDSDFNCYWGSYIRTQHSKNIEENGKVYITIYDSTVAPGEGEGVYIRGIGKRIEEIEEIVRIYNLMKKRHDNHFWPLEAMSGDGPIRFYKAAREHVWVNDGGKEKGVYVDTRRKLL